jgi:hypothetical protein
MKMSFFFSCTKWENRRVVQVLPEGVAALVISGRGKRWEKGMGG